MTATARLAAPLLAPGMAQKELFHNEALQLMEMAICACVESAPINDPPQTALPGRSYLIGNAPVAAWVGKVGHLATWTTAGWRFLAPIEGMTATIRGAGTPATYINGAWDVGPVRADSLKIGGKAVVGGQGASVANPAGGSIVDTEVRAAVIQILQRLRAHGLIAT